MITDISAMLECDDCQTDIASCPRHGVGTDYFHARIREIQASPGMAKIERALPLWRGGDIDEIQAMKMVADGMIALFRGIVRDTLQELDGEDGAA